VTDDDILPALVLSQSIHAADDAQARRLRAKAHRAGAVLSDLVEAVRLREERIAEEVTVIVADDEDDRPAPEDRCVHCGGWGWFEDVDGEGLDGDVPCGHCDQSGIEPA
jgi:hypothetical protein